MTTSTAVATATKNENGLSKLKATLNAPSVQQQFENALKENKDSFIASIIDLYSGDKSLQTCNVNALICEALRAATLHLPLNKSLGFAYIVVYNNSVKDETGHWHKVPTPTFVPGYKAYIQMAMRTGQYRTINADMVYEGELLSTNKLTGAIDFGGQKKSNTIVGYFCYFELLNGFNKTLFMTVEEMAAYAKRYAPSIAQETTVDQLIALAKSNAVGKKVGWMGNFNDMALKTVIRRLLSKYGYLSTDMQKTVVCDYRSEEGNDRDALIAENANTKTIELDSTTYTEVVDTETGEVTKKPVEAMDGNAQNAQPSSNEEEPNY